METVDATQLKHDALDKVSFPRWSSTVCPAAEAAAVRR